MRNLYIVTPDIYSRNRSTPINPRVTSGRASKGLPNPGNRPELHVQLMNFTPQSFSKIFSGFGCWMLLMAGCTSDESSQSQWSRDRFSSPATPSSPARLNAAFLPNAIRIHERMISGGQPAGEPAFRELQELGVKTIISVDGAKPDVETAKRYGLRYIHLPHGYNGISLERTKELAKAVRDLEGPIYIHCHHGKHRSPSAAAVACVSAGLVEPRNSLAILKLAGTNENYLGLFRSVETSRKIEDSILDAIDSSFPEIAELPPMAEAMVKLEHTYDHLKQAAAAGWKSPPDHPDIDPAHEALLLREHFAEMLRLECVANQTEDYRQLLKDSERASLELESLIAAWQNQTAATPAPLSLASPMQRIGENCSTCHRQFRDDPSILSIRPRL